MKLVIRDEAGEGGCLVPLSQLLRRILCFCPAFTTGTWRVGHGAYGYGSSVCSIEDQLTDKPYVDVDGDALFGPLLAADEYYYNVDMLKLGDGTRIGVFDSTYLYIVTSDQALADYIRGVFCHTEVLDEEEKPGR